MTPTVNPKRSSFTWIPRAKPQPSPRIWKEVLATVAIDIKVVIARTKIIRATVTTKDTAMTTIAVMMIMVMATKPRAMVTTITLDMDMTITVLRVMGMEGVIVVMAAMEDTASIMFHQKSPVRMVMGSPTSSVSTPKRHFT